MEEDGTAETAFHWIISAPGLSHIAELIFLQLDPKSLITCTEVCTNWKWYIIENRILKKNILNDKLLAVHDSSAPEHSHNRVLLKKLLGPKYETNDKVDSEEEFNAFRLYVDRMNPKQIEHRISMGQLPKVKVCKRLFIDLLKRIQNIHN